MHTQCGEAKFITRGRIKGFGWPLYTSACYAQSQLSELMLSCLVQVTADLLICCRPAASTTPSAFTVTFSTVWLPATVLIPSKRSLLLCPAQMITVVEFEATAAALQQVLQDRGSTVT